MRVPFARKWRPETVQLRQIALECGLTEKTKWGKPCFTYQDRNVALIIPLKEACALSFIKGALLKDPRGILQKIGEHSQSGRWIKFSAAQDIAAVKPVVKAYLLEAIEVETSGRKVVRKSESDYPVPHELQRQLDAAPKLKAAFAALTPGRRKSFLIHIAGAKQEKTRTARVAKCIPLIRAGRGFNERDR